VRPPEDDHSTGEDELLAQVIPLRRRANEGQEDLELSPITPHGRAPTGVFDPPEDPEPPEGYSVWDAPIAELIRRGEPEPTRGGAHSRAAGAPPGPRVLLSAAAAAALCSVLVLVLLGGFPGASTRPERAPSGAHASLDRSPATATRPGHPQGTAGRPRMTHATTRLHERHTRTATTGDLAGSQAATARAPNGVSQRSSAAVDLGGSVPVAQEQEPAAQATTASVQATATHEFGFER
jgi:hypothetical protein